MKTKFRFLSLAMVMVLSIGLLAACGSDDTTTTEEDSGTQTNSLSDESSETNAEVEDVIGEISYISSSLMYLKVYQPATEVSDYTSLDMSTLTAAGTTESITLETDAEYYYISDSSMVSQTVDDLTEGDMVAVTTTEDGIQQVILLEKGDVTHTEAEDVDNTEEDIVAEVTAIDGDILTLTVYEATETASAISDYAAVNLEDYSKTETQETYTVDSTVDSATEVFVVEDGIMTGADASEIVEGDMLVIYTTENGTSAIAIYHAE